jgi:hypothetical protein
MKELKDLVAGDEVLVTGNNGLGSIPHVKKSPLYDQFEITKVLTAFGHKDKEYE